MRAIIPIAFYATLQDISNGLANALPAGSSIFVVDANGQPTGIEYRATGNSAPTEGSGGIKNNFAGTTAPTITNDSSQGYSVGSRWIDTVGDESYICLDATIGGAVWSRTTVSTIGEIVNLQATLDGKSATTHNHDTAYTAIAHGTNTSNPHSVTKSQVSLGNVNDTSDETKNSATATITNKTIDGGTY